MAFVLAVALSGLVTWLSLSQPWLGLNKVIGAEGPGIALLDTAPNGPAAELTGTRLMAVVTVAGDRIEVTPQDALEEPDVIPLREEMTVFFARQGALHSALRAGPVTLVTEDGAFDVTARATRPLTSLPSVYWLQILVAVSSLALGGWAVSLRPNEMAARLFAVAGAGLAAAIFAAAYYSTRDLALPGAAFSLASNINMFGALTFGAFMGSMMLIYPVRLIPNWAIWVQPVIFGLWALGNPLGIWAGRASGAHLATALEMGLIILGLAAQVWATRKRPKERSIVIWFGLSVVLGSGIFIALMAVPGAMGYTPTIRQGHAFLLFLFVYLGLAIGVARYRMFDLGDWSFRLFYYAGGIALLFAVDAALISVLSLEVVSAFSASLLLVVMFYLPFRDVLSGVLRRRGNTPDLSDAIGAVALAMTPEQRRARFRNLLETAFRPLTVVAAPGPVLRPTLVDEGAALDMPGLKDVAPQRLHWTGGGHRLYSPGDVMRAERMMAAIARLDDLALARDRAVEEERARIDRDVHDNIGVQLLGALHSDQRERKDALIRQTLTDLRDIVANTKVDDAPLADVVADLRGEIGALYDAAGVALTWQDDGLPALTITASVAAALRAILREAAGNALRHSGATLVEVALTSSGNGMAVKVSDDGRGIAANAQRGNGLDNLTLRAQALGGTFEIETGSGGTSLTATLPFNARSALPLAGE